MRGCSNPAWQDLNDVGLCYGHLRQHVLADLDAPKTSRLCATPPPSEPRTAPIIQAGRRAVSLSGVPGPSRGL